MDCLTHDLHSLTSGHTAHAKACSALQIAELQQDIKGHRAEHAQQASAIEQLRANAAVQDDELAALKQAVAAQLDELVRTCGTLSAMRTVVCSVLFVVRSGRCKAACRCNCGRS